MCTLIPVSVHTRSKLVEMHFNWCMCTLIPRGAQTGSQPVVSLFFNSWHAVLFLSFKENDGDFAFINNDGRLTCTRCTTAHRLGDFASPAFTAYIQHARCSPETVLLQVHVRRYGELQTCLGYQRGSRRRRVVTQPRHSRAILMHLCPAVTASFHRRLPTI